MAGAALADPVGEMRNKAQIEGRPSSPRGWGPRRRRTRAPRTPRRGGPAACVSRRWGPGRRSSSEVGKADQQRAETRPRPAPYREAGPGDVTGDDEGRSRTREKGRDGTWKGAARLPDPGAAGSRRTSRPGSDDLLRTVGNGDPGSIARLQVLELDVGAVGIEDRRASSRARRSTPHAIAAGGNRIGSAAVEENGRRPRSCR